MKAIYVLVALSTFFCSVGFKQQNHTSSITKVIAQGAIPNVVTDNNNHIHLVYGKGDSIMYLSSTDAGITFSNPILVATLPKLFSFAMRGPQIAMTGNTLTIIASNQQGNIFSYVKDGTQWTKGARVNDRDTTAKEGFLALSGNGSNYLFAVWLDIRNGHHNNIYGAKSLDGGKTWSKNKRMYRSPDGHVCECCKPSVVVKNNKVLVMFRNWLNGNRDLYLIQSTDAGKTFGPAQKLGNGSWSLNGCPMDGGALTINSKDVVQTVWQRKGTIFTCVPDREERAIGQGRSCTMASTSGGNIYAWVDNGKVVCLLPDGQKQILGEGSLPVLKALGNNEVLCVWQQKDAIMKSILQV